MSHAPSSTDPTGRLSNEAAGRIVAGLYERHGRAVYGLCRLLLRNGHDAEDASQSVFLSAHRAITRGGAPRDAGAWLSAIARNECRGRVRDRMQEPVMADVTALDDLEAHTLPADELLPDPTVHKALASLSESQRDAVVLHDVFGLRGREVAAALGISLPAVEALLFRARRQLRMRLRPAAGALTTPVSIHEGLSALLPGFSSGAAGVSALAAGGATGGLIAKLAAAPVAAKIAAGVVAMGAGTATVTGVERISREDPARPAVARPASSAAEPSPVAASTQSATPGSDDDRGGPGGGQTSDERSERSGKGSGKDDDGKADDGGRSGRGGSGGSGGGDDDGDTPVTDPDDSDERDETGRTRSGSGGGSSAGGGDDDYSGSGGGSSGRSGSNDRDDVDTEKAETDTEKVDTDERIETDSAAEDTDSSDKTDSSGSGSGSSGSGSGSSGSGGDDD